MKHFHMLKKYGGRRRLELTEIEMSARKSDMFIVLQHYSPPITTIIESY